MEQNTIEKDIDGRTESRTLNPLSPANERF